MTTHTLTHDHQHHSNASDIFGFWIYMLSDCILFATVFTVYVVLRTSTFGGPDIKELTSIPYILIETMALLFSSVTYGLSILNLYQQKTRKVIAWLVITFLLGTVFIGMELNEFIQLYLEGHTWQTSAALSAFFTLVGTHGLHVSLGLLWMLVLIVQLVKFGITPMMRRRLTYLGLFWAFLDIIWIFVFTVVYLMGAI
jgi:cytochrome o ubiquinol oxidase subunit III